MADLDKSSINPDTGKAWAINPSTGLWDDNWFENVAKKQWLNSAAGSGQRALNTAADAQRMQLEANQPAIATLNQHKTDLDSKYADLLSSIGASEGVAGDAAKLGVNNELARRGIASNSGLGESEMAKGILPVSTQFGQLKATTGVNRENDLTGLAQEIASLQAGNVPNALNFGQGMVSLQQQAEQIANNYKISQDTLAKGGTTSNPYMSIAEGNVVIDTRTGLPVYTAPKTYKNTNDALNNNHGGV